MRNDQLYLLDPYTSENGIETQYCRDCAEIVGLLEYYPSLKERLDLHYITPYRPRRELVELLGRDNQDCPVLVMESCPATIPPQLGIAQGNGRLFIEGPRQIAQYLSFHYGTGTAR